MVLSPTFVILVVLIIASGTGVVRATRAPAGTNPAALLELSRGVWWAAWFALLAYHLPFIADATRLH